MKRLANDMREFRDLQPVETSQETGPDDGPDERPDDLSDTLLDSFSNSLAMARHTYSSIAEADPWSAIPARRADSESIRTSRVREILSFGE